MKVVINSDYGGFGLSREAQEAMGSCSHSDHREGSSRNCPVLIQVVEKLGMVASGPYARLKIIEIPDDAVSWYIDEYDGSEIVREGRFWH